jgi:SPP1 gp7 family putative phage head morphogenesis protein
MDARTSAADQVADAVRAHAVDLLRFDAGLRAKVLKLLREVERDLVRRLVDSEIEGEMTAAARARLEALVANLRATIATAYRSVDATVAGELMGLAQVESGFVAAAVARTVGVELLTTALAAPQLAAIVSDVLIEGAPTREWWSRQAGDVVERFKDTVRKGLVAGETNAEIVRRVRGTRANGFKDGMMTATRRHAEMLVRSSVQAVANKAQIDTYRANGDVVQSLVHLSTLDSRTSQICVGRSGLEYTLDGEPIGHKVAFLGGPPYHPNCRSVMVPRLKSWKALGIDLPEIPPSTRASMDGQVPADIGFDAWLKTKSTEFQDDLLGAGKADLWRKGKIGLSDLIDQSGRPLSLEQLRARSAR